MSRDGSHTAATGFCFWPVLPIALAACIPLSVDEYAGGGDAPDGATCAAPLADCDGSPGCETRLDSDAANCGTCGHDCLGGDCIDGACEPVPIAQGEAGPKGLTLYGQTLYWANYDEGSIRSLNLAGDDPTPATVQTGLLGVTAITIDRANLTIYWSEVASEPRRIMSFKLDDGGDPLLVAEANCEGLAYAGDYLYWTTRDTTSVLRASVVNGGAEELVAPAGRCAMGVAVATTDVYWVEQCDGYIARGSTDGGEPVVWTEDETQPWYVAVDDELIYWTSRDGGTVQRKRRDGSDEATVLARDQGAPAGIAVDSNYVYWVNRDAGDVMRLAK